VVGYGKEGLREIGIPAEPFCSGDKPEVELVLSGAEVGDKLGMVALGVVDEVAGVDLEELRQEQAGGVGEMGPGSALDLREIGLTDGGLAVGGPGIGLDGADELLLGHGAIEAAEVALDFPEVTDFVAELHLVITDRNIYIAICNTRQEGFPLPSDLSAYSIKSAAMSIEPMKVTVGVCGGIAAYKSVELVRLLQEAGYDPHVVMTKSAEEFVRPLTFSAISGHKVITSLWGEDAGAVSEDESSIEHIYEAQTTKLLIVAPATADMLAKFANGLADDFLSTMFLATKAPVIVAPAMNVNMWEHPATRANVATLRARGVMIVEPGSGYLACGMVGGGRLAEPAVIAAAVADTLGTGTLSHQSNTVESTDPIGPAPVSDFEGETVLVTAGGTREAIDPVRFIGNRSSGRMGYAVAEAARRRGARVILISAPTGLHDLDGVEIVRIVTSEEMRAAMMQRLREATIVVMAAAVSDFRVRSAAAQKIKREAARAVLLELEATEDILQEVVERRIVGTIVVGFAAETEDALANGRLKLARKGVDAVMVNDVSMDGIGFDAEQNAGSFLTKNGVVEFPVMSKTMMAERILDEVAKLRG
jgi:phosphopantothenoylcysteine decarboxylase / phosphopantothenate---cysteine ligase